MWVHEYWGMHLFWWLFWFGAGLLLYFTWPARRTARRDLARESLRRRFADGDITEDELRRRLAVLDDVGDTWRNRRAGHPRAEHVGQIGR
ncbi:MAG: hypothetical protein SFX73_12615 [Kofleriaceae bacterium]|nr:hypothetical protein [Kofleriaceae bacterium]